MSYQKPDQAYINYNVYSWGRLEQHYRGPKPLMTEPYIACLGGAQTFGRYTTHPFPALLEDMLGMEVANFGTGGAGPGFFLRDSTVMEAACNAEVCVVQVMSARSLSNRLFKVKADRNAQIKAVSKALEDLFPHIDFETFTYAHNMLNQIEENDPQRFEEVEMELKTAWVARTRLLLESIHTKKILFWFSERAPDADIGHTENRAALKYPQFVDDRMLEAVSPYTDKIVHCVSDEGLPQSLLIDGEAVLQTPYGMPVAENRYYPSPEMHCHAAETLARPIYDLIRSDAEPVHARSNVNI
ncbi:MAG: DUF6473 family protein [Pseudomonadota bacterium]